MLGGYETNIDFQAAGNEIDDWAGAVRGSLGRGWKWPRGQLFFSMNGTGVRYNDERAAPRGHGSASLSWSEQLSPRVGFSLAGYGSGGTTTSQTFVDDLGQVLPRTLAIYYGGSSGFDFKLGRRSSFRIGGAYGRVHFDDPSLVSTQTMSGQASLSREIGADDTISFNYHYRRTEDEDRGPIGNHAATLGWARTLSRHFSMDLYAGVGYNPRALGQVEQEWYFTGSAGISASYKTTTLSFRVGQAATPAYGFGGNQLTDNTTLSTVLPFGRHVQLSLGAGHSRGRSLSGDRPSYNNDHATAALRIALSRHAGMELSYNYRRSKPDDGTARQAQRGYFGFVYSLP